MAKWNWIDDEAKTAVQAPPTLREALIELIRADTGTLHAGLVDRILADYAVIPAKVSEMHTDVANFIHDLMPLDTDEYPDVTTVVYALQAHYAMIPKVPTDGLEVEVPGWIVDQIKADAILEARAGLMESIDRASALAVSVAERETTAYMKGWNEALAAVARGDEAEPMTHESVIEDAEAIVDEEEAMRQADA